MKQAILLVGGFGCSPYLFERLQAEKFGMAGKAIEIIQPVNARTAIARGALLRGLDGSNVANKRARRFYGVPANTALASHPKWESRRYWDAVEGKYKVPDHLTWYIKKVLVPSESTSEMLSGVSNAMHQRARSQPPILLRSGINKPY